MKITLTTSGQSFDLSQGDYVAGGGEGKIYRKGSTAFKIYHDPAKMIPLGKIQALCALTPKNVLAPRDICESNRKKVGFTMKYIADRIYLCWMFNKMWKQKNNIDIGLLNFLINKMRETTIILHQEGCVVGDYNELQFLVDKKFSDVYFCDANSYQIKGYPCTAIMDTVRDRTVPFGSFSEKTDWFGFAIVTSQLFTGIHPYQGNHPNFSRREIKELILMDKGLSIFNKNVTLPRQAEPLNTIPKSLRGWYEAVLEKKERTIPPTANDLVSVIIQPRTIVQGTDSFMVKEIISLPEPIINAQVINGIIYCITKKAIYKDNKVLAYITNAEYAVIINKGSIEPLIVKRYGTELTVNDKGNELISLHPDDYFIHLGKLYTISNGKVILNTAEKLGVLTIISPKVMANIFESSYKVYQGVVVQDIVGIPWIVVPAENVCHNIQISELTGHRVLDAKYDEGGDLRMCIIISEFKSKYYKSLIIFKKGGPSNGYDIKSTDTINSDIANFTILNKSVAACIVGDERLDLITQHGTKEIQDPPFDSSMQLFTDGVRVLVINGSKILHISTK